MIRLTGSQQELLASIVEDYIESHTTAHQCQVCGATHQDHRIPDCPVKIASEILQELRDV